MKIYTQDGFTIIELMIAVTLIAILLTFGIPGFGNTIEQNRLSTQVNTLISTLQLARSESVKTGKRITVCKSSNGSSCQNAAAGFESGWIVFEDSSPADGALSAGERLIKIQESLNSNHTLRGDANFANFVSYLPSGAISNDPGRFILCKDNDTTKSRAVFINTSGRVFVAKDNNQDKIPEDTAGNNISACT